MVHKQEDGFVWLPRDPIFYYKILVNGTDITDDIIDLKLTRQSTEGIGFCDITTTQTLEIKEEIKVFIDTESINTSSTSQLRFIGNVSEFNDAERAKVKAYEKSSTMLDITVTESYTETDPAEIIKDLVDNYLSNFTYDNVDNTNQTVNISWSNRPIWSAFKNLCKLVNYTLYVDVDNDIHFFERGSITNQEEAVVARDNMLEMRGIGNTTSEIKNRIIVYGKSESGLPIVATAEDTDSISNIGIKEKIIKDNNISNETTAQERANAELQLYKDPVEKGTAKCSLLPNLSPGELIWVSYPSLNLQARYEVYKYTHNLPQETTKVYLREPQSIPKILRQQKESDLRLEEITNPFKLDYSFNIDFEDTSKIETLTDTEIDSGYLQLESGKSTGTMVSATQTLDDEISIVQLKYSGDNLENANFYVSATAGVNDFSSGDEINRNEQVSLISGDHLKVKVELNDSSSRLDGVAVLYK